MLNGQLFRFQVATLDWREFAPVPIDPQSFPQQDLWKKEKGFHRWKPDELVHPKRR